MRNSERDVEPRREAQALWDEHKKQDEKVLNEREKERLVGVAKVERLRELRLAKEAEGRKSAAQTFMTHRTFCA